MLRTPYEAVSPDGPEHWPAVVAKFKEMVTTQPTIGVEQLGGIKASTLVVVGDDDIVTLEHPGSLFRAIPKSELAVVPGTSHLAAMEKPELVNRVVLDPITAALLAQWRLLRRPLLPICQRSAICT